jgi:hypothetical protein
MAAPVLGAVLRFIEGATEAELELIGRSLIWARHRSDPIAELPLEIVEQVLEAVRVSDLGAAASVCRQWRSAVRTSTAAWRAGFARLTCFDPMVYGDERGTRRGLPDSTPHCAGEGSTDDADGHSRMLVSETVQASAAPALPRLTPCEKTKTKAPPDSHHDDVDVSVWYHRCRSVKLKQRALRLQLEQGLWTPMAQLPDSCSTDTHGEVRGLAVVPMPAENGLHHRARAVVATIGPMSNRVRFWHGEWTGGGLTFERGLVTTATLPWGVATTVTAAADEVLVASTDGNVYGLHVPVAGAIDMAWRWVYAGHTSRIFSGTVPRSGASMLFATAGGDWTARVWQRHGGPELLRWDVEHPESEKSPILQVRMFPLDRKAFAVIVGASQRISYREFVVAGEAPSERYVWRENSLVSSSTMLPTAGDGVLLDMQLCWRGLLVTGSNTVTLRRLPDLVVLKTISVGGVVGYKLRIGPGCLIAVSTGCAVIISAEHPHRVARIVSTPAPEIERANDEGAMILACGERLQCLSTVPRTAHHDDGSLAVEPV